MGRRKKLEELAPNVGTPVGEFVEEFVVKPSFDADGVQVSSGIGKDGREYCDPVPMSVPVDGQVPVPLFDMIKMMVERVRKPEGEELIDESEEEADDFEIEDDPLDPLTEYERVFVPKVEPKVVLKPEVPVVASSSEPAPAPAVVVPETKLT